MPTTPKIVGAMVILAVTASGAYFFILRDIKPEQSRSGLPTATSTTTTVSQPAAATTSVNTPASTASTSGYKDGTYTATAGYYVPHG